MKIFLALWMVLQVFFYNEDGNFEYDEISVPIDFPVQYQAWVVFTQIFELDDFDFVPSDVQVLDVYFDAACGTLVLDLSQEAINYGGTYFEYRFTQKLIKNALSLPGVRYFTVLIEGQLQEFPEGVKIYRAFFCQ